MSKLEIIEDGSRYWLRIDERATPYRNYLVSATENPMSSTEEHMVLLKNTIATLTAERDALAGKIACSWFNRDDAYGRGKAAYWIEWAAKRAQAALGGEA